MAIELTEQDVLVIVDVQNDFCGSGALAVREGEQVVPIANGLIEKFAHVILTQDWHPADHESFASSHPGKNPFSAIELSYGIQTLWPNHCVQGTPGAAFHPDLNTDAAELVIRKGFRKEIDSYSAFFENDQKTQTGLKGYLKERGFERVHLCGLATDFCVAFSAIDAIRCGFTSTVIEDACRAIDMEGSLDHAKAMMSQMGVSFSESGDYG